MSAVGNFCWLFSVLILIESVIWFKMNDVTSLQTDESTCSTGVCFMEHAVVDMSLCVYALHSKCCVILCHRCRHGGGLGAGDRPPHDIWRCPSHQDLGH